MVTAHGHQGRGGGGGAIGLALGRGGRCATRDLPVLCQLLLLCDVYTRYALLCCDVCRAAECQGLRGTALPPIEVCAVPCHERVKS